MQFSQAEIKQLDQQKYNISGTVDFSTVPGLIQRVIDLFKPYKKSAATQSKSHKLTFDLAPVTDCDSAGLAMMLEIFKQAHLRNIHVHFENMPATLLTIAKAYGIESEIRKICK